MLQGKISSVLMVSSIIVQDIVTWASVTRANIVRANVGLHYWPSHSKLGKCCKGKHCHSKLGQCCKGKQFLGRCWARAWRHADDAPESVDFYLEKNKQNPALLLNNVFLKSSYTIHNFANARYVFMPSVLFLLGFSFPIWRRSVRPEPPACSNERCT